MTAVGRVQARFKYKNNSFMVGAYKNKNSLQSDVLANIPLQCVAFFFQWIREANEEFKVRVVNNI